MKQLPHGWALTSIADIASFNPKTIADDALECAFTPMQYLGTRFRAQMNYEQKTWGEIKKSYVHFQTGDVIIAKVTPCFENGKAGIAPNLPNGIGAGSSEFCVFRPAQGVNERYLLAWLSSEDFRKRAAVAMTGSVGLKRVPKEVFLTEEIPLAPEEEQCRIADKLDTTLARVDALNDRLARITPLLKRFRQSVLAAATSGRLTGVGEKKITPIVLTDSQKEQLPRNWEWKNLQNIAKLESGHTPRKSVPEYWENGDVPWISLQDIRAADGTVIFDTKFMPNKNGIDNSSARLLPKDTVCFCRDISFGFVTIMGREMATSQHFANWICGKDLLPKYLMYSFMAARDNLSLSGQGSTVTTIYMPALKAMQIAVPPREEQTEIVRRVETLFAFADRLEARLQCAQTAAERLTPALLAKAFRGELVPQDPNDEPATELLRRLREARAAQVPAKPKRGRKASTTVV